MYENLTETKNHVLFVAQEVLGTLGSILYGRTLDYSNVGESTARAP